MGGPLGDGNPGIGDGNRPDPPPPMPSFVFKHADIYIYIYIFLYIYLCGTHSKGGEYRFSDLQISPLRGGGRPVPHVYGVCVGTNNMGFPPLAAVLWGLQADIITKNRGFLMVFKGISPVCIGFLPCTP